MLKLLLSVVEVGQLFDESNQYNPAIAGTRRGHFPPRTQLRRLTLVRSAIASRRSKTQKNLIIKRSYADENDDDSDPSLHRFGYHKVENNALYWNRKDMIC